MNKTCHGCSQDFSQKLLPRKLRNCSHIICEKCILRSKECPYDGIAIELQKYSMKKFGVHIKTLQEVCQSNMQINSEKSIQSTAKSNDAISPSPEPEEKKQKCATTKQIREQPTSIQQEKQKSQTDQYTSKKIQVVQQISQTSIVEQKKSQNPTKKQLQLCDMHNKVLDVICMMDGERICANCALFGAHKGHEFLSCEQFIVNMTSITQQTLNTFSLVKQKQENLNKNIVKEYIHDTFSRERTTHSKRIKQFTSKIIESIKETEKNILNELDRIIQEKKQIILSSIEVKQLQEKTHEWYQQVGKLGELMQSVYDLKNTKQCFKFLDRKHQESYIIERGQYLQIQYCSNENIWKELIDNQAKMITVNFDEKILSKIQQTISISNSLTAQQAIEKIKTPEVKKQYDRLTTMGGSKQNQDDNEDNLLDNVHQEYEPQQNNHNSSKIIVNLSLNSFQIKQSSMNDSLENNEIMAASVSTIVGDNNSFLPRNDDSCYIANLLKTHTDRQLLRIVSDPGNKVLPVPSAKFQQALQNLKSDKIDTIDFTNSGLDDELILTICPYILKSKKVKTLKLSKNNLTDICLQQLLSSCAKSQIINLNLSSNNFTKKVLQLLDRTGMKNLRTICLTGNKINKLAVKIKLDTLYRKNIVVTL